MCKVGVIYTVKVDVEIVKPETILKLLSVHVPIARSS